MNIQPKKSLGQHFLNSPSVLAKIIAAAEPKNGEKILEIGPGTGILTAALLKTGTKVVAVEKDERAYELLRGRFGNELASGALTLHRDDILEADMKKYGLSDGNFAVVANIPYYITGAILKLFLEDGPRPNRMVLLVQKEVADRIVARDGKESILSISVKAFGDPKFIEKVPRGAFNPPPTVDSAILSVGNISDEKFVKKCLEIRRFFDIVKAGFAHKRKFAKRNLETLFEKGRLDRLWQNNNLDEKLRAEDMSLDHWLDLACE